MEIWEMILRLIVILMCYDYIYGNNGILMGHLKEHNGTIDTKFCYIIN